MISDAQQQALIAAARDAQEMAYAPYSGYPVGAALLGGDGRIYTGCNVENASFGLSNCAERTAVFKMVSEGQHEILAVAVCTDNAGSPCGACRQVLNEFRPPGGDFPVILDDGLEGVLTSIEELLPRAFGPRNLAE